MRASVQAIPPRDEERKSSPARHRVAVALLVLLCVSLAWAQEIAPVTTVPATPVQKFKMEKDRAVSPGAMTVLRFSRVQASATGTDAAGAATQALGASTCYVLASEVWRVEFDQTPTLSGYETTRVYLRRGGGNGGYIVVTGRVEDVWERWRDASGLDYVPARGVKE